jgi:hypothetical protein
VLFALASGYVHQDPGGCPTALSRLDLLHAVQQGTVTIDAYHSNTSDVAAYRGHYYSDKAPGTVALAWPAFAAGAAGLRFARIPLDSTSGWIASSWAATFGSNGVLGAVGLGCLMAWASRYAGLKASVVAGLGIFMGGAPLPYATMLFSHAIVMGLIAVALWAITTGGQSATPSNRDSGAAAPGAQPRQQPPQWDWLRTSRWDLLAGFTCGWTLASEYTAGIVIVGVAIWLARQRWRRLIPFCLGAIPPLLLIPLYSWLCFRDPFILPYSLNASFPEMKHGLYAIGWPDAETAFNLLFSPARGLFFWTPFLVMAGFGYPRLAKTNPGLFRLTYVLPLLQVVVISGRVWDWPAGPTLGPRYLAPILPLLALPCALGVKRFPRLGTVLAAYSILITTMATLTNAAPPASYYNPLTELHIPLLLKGNLAPNLGTVMGLSPHVSVALFYLVLLGGMAWLWHKLPKESYAQKQQPSQSTR